MAFISALTVFAGEWPQRLGPHRNGLADEERLAVQWPDPGPPVPWQRPVGRGLAGVATAQHRLVLFHREGRKEIAEALDPDSGEGVWKKGFATGYVSRIDPDDGPRCVPLIHGDRVYLFGAGGNLHCLALSDGSVRWSRALYQEFGAEDGYFGAGSCPLVEGDRILVNVGARGGAGLVALACDTGELIWKSTDEGASYSAPVATTIDGTRQVIFVTRLNCLSVDPANGQVHFRFPFGKRGPTVNAATPLILGSHLFVSASYGVGAKLVEVQSSQANVVWENDTTMSSQYATCVDHQGTFYGIDGRQDVGIARLRAFDPMTGSVFWTEEEFGMATLILADGKLIIMKTNGELVIAEPDPRRYRPLSQARIFSETTRALPALANGRLYVRDAKTLKCVDLSRKKKP